MPDENVYTEAHGFKFPNGTTIPIEDAEAREDISEIKQSLSDLLKTTTESTASITVGGANVGWGVTYTTPTGYSLLDCHIQTVSYSGENCINIEGITSSQVTGYVRNLTGNTRSIVVTVKFIFVKSGMLG